MALLNLKFYSESLKMQTEVFIVMPQKNTDGEIGISAASGSGRYKCLYLLLGQSDAASIWLRRTSIERYAAACGLCVVMPAAGLSYYTDMKYGQNYYTYISRELPRIVAEYLNISQAREDTYIAGLSMGGYGALKIALRNPERYCAAAGLSPVADVSWILADKALSVPIFGDVETVPPEEDLFYLTKAHDGDACKPRLYVGIGTEDFIYDADVRFHRWMEGLHYDLTWRESPGTHSWEFWDEYIQYVLQWMVNP